LQAQISLEKEAKAEIAREIARLNHALDVSLREEEKASGLRKGLEETIIALEETIIALEETIIALEVEVRDMGMKAAEEAESKDLYERKLEARESDQRETLTLAVTLTLTLVSRTLMLNLKLS